MLLSKIPDYFLNPCSYRFELFVTIRRNTMTTAGMTSAMSDNVWEMEKGEVRKPGIVHIVALALFTGIGIVVGTFGSLAVPIGFVSALWGTTVLRLFGLITPSAQPVAWAGWFLGNSVASWVLGVLMLKFLSPLVVKTKAFCKGYWA